MIVLRTNSATAPTPSHSGHSFFPVGFPGMARLLVQSNKAMKLILSKLLARSTDLVNVQPVLALFLGGAFLTVFLTTVLKPKPTPEPEGPSSLLWMLYHQGTRFLW